MFNRYIEVNGPWLPYASIHTFWGSVTGVWWLGVSRAFSDCAWIHREYTLWLFNISMENGPFIGDLSWLTYQKYSNMAIFQFATLNHQTGISSMLGRPTRGRIWSYGAILAAKSQPDFYRSAEDSPIVTGENYLSRLVKLSDFPNWSQK